MRRAGANQKLAKCHRAGDLEAIYIPEATDEAIRDLCRARTDAVDDQRRARQRLKAFLLQHGYAYQGKGHWGQAHMARRVHRNKALVAMARELTGFIWEALRDLPCYQAQPDAKQKAA